MPMPIRRLRALSVCSKLGLLVQPGEVGVQGKLAAVAVLEPRAFGPQLGQELEHERGREPDGVEGVDAAHVDRVVLQRLDLHAADPVAVVAFVRRPDARVELDALAVLQDRGDQKLGDDRLHHGIGEPSWEKNLPESVLLSPASTLRRPATESCGASGALSPPMSVRTQPGLSATTFTPRPASVAARPLTSMLSAALLVPYGSVIPLDSVIEPSRLDIIAMVFFPLAATLSTSASASAAAPSTLTRSTSSQDS